MSQEEIELQGTVRPDGSLVLDEKLELPAGRVHVTVRLCQEAEKPDPVRFGVLMEHLEQTKGPAGMFRGVEKRVTQSSMNCGMMRRMKCNLWNAFMKRANLLASDHLSTRTSGIS